MKYRIDRDTLLNTLSIWDSHLHKKVHLIACGGTALTLLNVKGSTKDVDFLIPDEREYKYLLTILKDLGYERITGAGWKAKKGFIFDLYPGKKIFTTDLVESPLKEGNNTLLTEFAHIYLGVLNHYDLITSKLFRSTGVDIEDCLALFKAKGKEIDMKKLSARFYETSSYDVSDDRNKKDFALFLDLLKKREGIKHEK